MNSIISFDEFASQWRAFVSRTSEGAFSHDESEAEFNRLSIALFSLQSAAVPVYQKFCDKRKITSPQNWRDIPALPTSAFKDYELSSLPPEERTRVFHSSGTTQQTPSRHSHGGVSLKIYEESLLPWFAKHIFNSQSEIGSLKSIILTPNPALTPNSSLGHMFETVGKDFADSVFTGKTDAQGAWALDIESTLGALAAAESSNKPVVLMGTAFSYVHLLDHCKATKWRYELAAGSRVMETGGYKGRSRVVAKTELRQMISRWIGIPESHIVSEYGMSELSSQAYDRIVGGPGGVFHFPPWARAQIISPETGREVGVGETGMVRVFDLANMRSIMAIQTEDLAVRRGDGFELIGRAADAEPRGCSLMAASTT